jgi:hypothetical protein
MKKFLRLSAAAAAMVTTLLFVGYFYAAAPNRLYLTYPAGSPPAILLMAILAAPLISGG